ncbi:hypothetical protein KQI63_13150 [bacterium]|nr:hypothetical protein [bacterium]
MTRRSLYWVATVLLGLVLASPVGAIQVQTRFVASNPQIFPVGDIVDIDAIQGDEDIDLSTLPELFEVEITNSTPDELDDWMVLEVRLETAGLVLVNYVSSNFQLRDWINGPGRNGVYNNVELDNLELGERDESYYGDLETFLDLLDGSNLSSGVYILTVTVFAVEPNEEGGEKGSPLANGIQLQQVQVFNPSSPQLQSPDEGEEITALPIFFTWDWTGSSNLNANEIELIIVEGDPGEDGETVISSANSSNTMFRGSPALLDSYTYTGFAGEERSLTPGATYYWMVRFNVNTVVPGEGREFDSNVFSFTYAAEDPGTGGGTTGGNVGGGSGGTTQGGNDPLLDQLSGMLPSDVMQNLMNELQGFTYEDLTIDGISGFTQQDLMSLLNNPNITIITVGLEE